MTDDVDAYAVVPPLTSGRPDPSALPPGALDPSAPPLPPARTLESGALKPGMNDALRREKLWLGFEWDKQVKALYKQAADLEQAANNPGQDELMRADALRDAAIRLEIAQGEVGKGKDPRIALGYAAQALEAAGYAAEAAKLRKAAEEFTEFLDKVRTFTVDGEYPPGVMDFSKNLGGADAGNSPDHPYHVLESEYYEVVSGPGMGRLLTSTPPPRGAPPPALLDAASPSFPGGQGALDPPPGGHGSGAAADSTGAVRRQGDPPSQQPVRLEIPALQRLDAEGDDVRRLLDVEPVQVVDAGEDATSVARLDVDPGTGTEGGRAGTGVEGINPAGRPEFSGSGAHWQVEVPGPGRLDPDTGASAVLGDYAEVVHQGDSAVDGVSGGQGTVHAAPPDTRAAVDAMPDTSRVTGGDYQTVAESRRKLAEGNALISQLNAKYMDYRRDSVWRGVSAYGQPLDELRDDMFEMLREFGAYTDAADGVKGNSVTLYIELVKAAENAAEAGDLVAVQRIGEFLDGFNQKMQDMITDLGSRAEEFEAVRMGTDVPLDPHIDQDKLAQWLDERKQHAADRMLEASAVDDAEAMKAWSNEMSYYDQLKQALVKGRSPLAESGDQIEFLRLTDKPEQADQYQRLEFTVMEVLSDPSFHQTAAEMGDATYAPVHFMRPDLGTAPTLDDTAVPVAVDNVDTDVLSAEVREPGGAPRGDDGAQLDPGDYAANRDTINDQAGQGDYVHAPQDQPSGLSDEDYDPDDLIATADANANEMERGYVQTYMDIVAQSRGDAFKQQFMADNPGGVNIDDLQNFTDKAAMRARVDAANEMWGQVPAVDRRSGLCRLRMGLPPAGHEELEESEATGGRFGQVRGCEADHVRGRVGRRGNGEVEAREALPGGDRTGERPGCEPGGQAGTDTV